MPIGVNRRGEVVRGRGEHVDFVLVRAKHILVAAAEVGMDLPREQGVLGDIRAAGVFILWQHEKPGDADYDAEEGDVGREFEEARVAAEGEDAGWRGFVSYGDKEGRGKRAGVSRRTE